MKYSINKIITLLAALWIITNTATGGERIKVACIGNSITYGFLLPEREKNCYPAQLQQMLGADYEVGNFGKSGATLLKHGHRPYNEQQEYRDALSFNADIAVIHLGVNDTDPRNWPNYNDEFMNDYMSLIGTLRTLNPKMRIIIARLTPLNAKHFRFKSGTRDWRLQIQDAIERVAQVSGAELIDFDAPLRDRQNLLPDGIHPDAEGAKILAKTVYEAITGNYGGLQMPIIYTSGMVLQRDRYLKIEGTADSGSEITLSIDGRSYRAIANNRGEWNVTIVPLTAGTGYTMTVTDGKRTLRYDDVAAGEVWVASGQSNMEFRLQDAIGSAPDIATSNDKDLRFFDMKEICRTDDREWTEAELDSIDALHHFRHTHWENTTSNNAGIRSAVAYHFGKILRDSLKVPVGIISNAVGGSPQESWIDINTLEAEMPEILIDWRKNDYVQKWAQGRADKNTALRGDKSRHPYEPSYLFSSGILPLGHYTIAGAIWYQGESNAHNIEIYERLFPMFVKSWREYFRNDKMPIYFAQLSSIDRPSWSQFRDTQRRLCKETAYTGMAVTSDCGDSLDVHPRNKRPVGERLARLALHNTYGYSDITPNGPLPEKTERAGNAIEITMSNAKGLKTSDGKAPRTFEIAETEGIYYPAIAEIHGNKIKVYNMNIKSPKYVRYGWQPFTRANVVNADMLPASTFKTEIEHDDKSPEQGMECGVSACYAGKAGNNIVIAGGCNFPESPLAADSKKKFYRGIYAADTATMQWKKIGELPEAMAYGASATTPAGIVLAGGTTATASLDKVWLLRIADDMTTSIDELPSLPSTMDNMSACTIGNKVYLAGGNVNGEPSTALYSIDLNDKGASWRKLRPMPGNPRVQPAMASGTDASGERVIYLWGGFAGKGENRKATLETSGLKYAPSKDKWEKLDAPTTSDGTEISTGGGAATTLSDGRIAVCGGVNKDIFLEALRNQAPDYMNHPIEWYRFNDRVLVFSPQTEQWTIHEPKQGTARAGASIIAGSDCDFYLYGGELKPRIRTSETVHIQLGNE